MASRNDDIQSLIDSTLHDKSGHGVAAAAQAQAGREAAGAAQAGVPAPAVRGCRGAAARGQHGVARAHGAGRRPHAGPLPRRRHRHHGHQQAVRHGTSTDATTPSILLLSFQSFQKLENLAAS